MNRIYRSIWRRKSGTFVAVSELASSRGGKSSPGASIVTGGRFALKALAASLMMAFGSTAYALPEGGQIVAGTGSISRSGATATIQQSSQNVAVNWKSFNVAAQETVNFVQPSAAAIAVNRIFDTNGTQILGRINANGQVYLINPNGILFGQGAQVNVGGLVASTLELNDATLTGNARSFSGNGAGSVINQGSITAAKGGYVALLGNHVSNQGSIVAPQGAVALGAGSAATLTFQDNSLVKMQVDQSVLNSLAENGGLIRADGGMVLMSAGARDALLASVVNNSGVIEARTVENREGSIILLGGMAAGTTKVGGTLDTSAPAGGNGGFIETSAAHVKIADDAKITTAAAMGLAGTWLIDPVDFTIAASGGDITGTALSNLLQANSVTVQTDAGTNTASNLYGTTGANGDIYVNDTVSWSANTLTLKAHRNIDINAPMNGTGAARLALEYGQGAVAAGNTSKVTVHAVVNLPEGPSYSTRQGSNGIVKNFTVITSLGAAGDAAAAPATPTLQGMAAIANLATNYALGADISAVATASWNGNTGFTPIGNGATQYSGTFDGLGHDIANLNLKPGSGSSSTYSGMFGWTTAAAEVRNVGLVNVVVSHSVDARTGALIARNQGKVSNSYVTGSVKGNTYLGGLVGWNQGSIDGSYFSGTARAGNRVGGLVGVNEGAISNSYSIGVVAGLYGQDLVGGLVGHSTGSISNSYASASVSNAGQNTTGGLAGRNDGTITRSYWNSSKSALPGIGGGTLAGATALTSAQMKQQASFVIWDFANTWLSQEGLAEPLLRAFMTPLTVTANNASKAYDGQAYDGVGGVSYSTPPNGNLLGTVSYGSASQTPLNAGSYTLTPSGLYSAQQGYIISYVSGTLTVNPALVNLVATRTYDATTNFVAAVFGVAGTIGTGVGTEKLVLTGAGTVGSANVSAGVQTLNLGALALGNGSGLASNYTLAGGTHTGQVTPKVLTGTVTAPDKAYDGTTTATPTLIITAGLVGSERVNAAGTATFNSKDVASANLVTVNSISLNDGINGGLGSNYRLDPGQSVAAGITAKALTIGGITAADKTYDGGTAATVNTAGASYGGLVNGDAVAVSATGAFADKHAGNGKTVNLSSSYSGADVGNYSITNQASTTASITARALTIGGITAADKTYDGGTAAMVNTTNASYGGLLSGDAVTVSATGTFADKNVGANKAVALNGSYSGADVGNYSITNQTSTTAGITAASLAVANVTANSKLYDGTIAATLRGAPGVTGFGSDVVKVVGAGNAAFADANVGTGKAVTVSGFTLGGADAGNYMIVQPAGLTAAINDGAPPQQLQNITGELQSNLLPLQPSSSSIGRDASPTIVTVTERRDVGKVNERATSSPGSANFVVMNVGNQDSQLHIVNGGVRLPGAWAGEAGK